MLTLVFIAALGAAPTPEEYVASLDGAPVLTLEEALEIAVKENFDIRIAQTNLERSALLSKKAYGVVLPNVNASYDYAVNNVVEAEIPGAGTIVLQDRTQQRAAVAFDWTLVSGRSLPLILNAYDAVDQSILQYDQQRETLLFATSLAYFNALTAQRTVRIRERALDISKRNAELANAQSELGSASSVDTLRAEVAVATAEQDLVQAQITKLLADRALAVLINRIDARGQLTPFRLERPPVPITDERDLLDIALEERFDLKLAELDFAIADRLVDESYTKFLPELVMTGSLSTTNVAGFGANNNWNVTFSARWALFEGGQTYWELRERKYDVETAAIAIEQNKVRIADNVEQSRLNLANAQSNYEAALRRADLARRSSELAQAQFEVGASTQLEVLDANRSLADAEASEALGQLQVDLARLELERVTKIDPSTVAGGDAQQPAPPSPTDALTASVAGGGEQTRP